MVDAFERIATVFKKDCVHRLCELRKALSIIDFSENMAMASRLIFVQSSIYIDDLGAIQPEIERMESCIEFMKDAIFHAKRLHALNFNSSDDVFKKEICFSYTSKMLNSAGPRLMHFSGSPTSDQVVEAELHLALHSPYMFSNEGCQDLYCYERMD
jgi:hypothetical protein